MNIYLIIGIYAIVAFYLTGLLVRLIIKNKIDNRVSQEVVLLLGLKAEIKDGFNSFGLFVLLFFIVQVSAPFLFIKLIIFLLNKAGKMLTISYVDLCIPEMPENTSIININESPKNTSDEYSIRINSVCQEKSDTELINNTHADTKTKRKR